MRSSLTIVATLLLAFVSQLGFADSRDRVLQRINSLQGEVWRSELRDESREWSKILKKLNEISAIIAGQDSEQDREEQRRERQRRLDQAAKGNCLAFVASEIRAERRHHLRADRYAGEICQSVSTHAKYECIKNAFLASRSSRRAYITTFRNARDNCR